MGANHGARIGNCSEKKTKTTDEPRFRFPKARQDRHMSPVKQELHRRINKLHDNIYFNRVQFTKLYTCNVNHIRTNKTLPNIEIYGNLIISTTLCGNREAVKKRQYKTRPLTRGSHNFPRCCRDNTSSDMGNVCTEFRSFCSTRCSHAFRTCRIIECPTCGSSATDATSQSSQERARRFG